MAYIAALNAVTYIETCYIVKICYKLHKFSKMRLFIHLWILCCWSNNMAANMKLAKMRRGELFKINITEYMFLKTTHIYSTLKDH